MKKDSDGVLDMDSKQLTNGLVYPDLDTGITFKKPLKELDSEHLEYHVYLFHHFAQMKTTHLNGLEPT